MRDLFIAHSTQDAQTAATICSQMEAAGISCWIAPRDMHVGGQASYGGALIEAINSSSMMVVILSSHSNKSPQVIREVERAVTKGIPILPIEIEKSDLSPDLEFFLGATHRYDATTGPLSQHIQTVVKRVLHLRDRPQESSGSADHTRPPVPSTAHADLASRSSLRNLLDRRLPQYLALYVGGTWGVVQFIHFLEERYPTIFSPHWTDIALLGFALLMPAVALFVYNHGRPGKDQWTRTERVAIPLNLVVAAAVLFMIFGKKDLGAVMTTVTTQDETGKVVERDVAAASYRQRLALFNFDAPAGDTTLSWLRYGLPAGVSADLSQDIFIDVRVSTYFREKLRQLGFKDEVNVPLSLKRQIAQEQHLPYFTDAKIGRTGDTLTVDLALYEATGREVGRERLKAGNPFSMIDQISGTLKEMLEVPETDKVVDLPVTEVLTSSLPAFRHYAEAITAIQVRDQWPLAVQEMEKAVQVDSTFAFAWLQLHNFYLFTNQGSKALPPLEKTMDLLYRLPERNQYDVKAEHYVIKEKNMDKAIAVLKMRVDLFPEDINGYLVLSQLQQAVDDKDGVIASYQKILELDPGQHERVRELGALYEAKGDFENALNSYTRYAELFPAKPEALVSIGSLLRLQGKQDQARTNFEKALLLNSDDINAILRMAALERDLGNFDAALKHYNNALATARTPQARLQALEAMTGYYDFRGQTSEAIRVGEQALQQAAQIGPPLMAATKTMSSLGRYVRAGQVDRARRDLQRLSAELQPPFDGFIGLGELRIALEVEQPEEAERAVARVEDMIRTLGYKVFAPIVSNARGEIAEMRGQCEAAITQYELTLKLAPTDASTHMQIGRCYRKLRQPRKASEHLEQAIKVVPFQPTANYELGLALLDAGDRDKARQHLQRAVTVWSGADPSHKEAAEAKAKLSQLAGS